MDRLSELIAVSVLHKAGAREIYTTRKGFGRQLMVLAWFTFNGIGHVWKIRGDAYKQNFEADVERELGQDTQQKVA